MSDFYKPTYLQKNALHTQYLNGICNLHDLWCRCDDPLKHTVLTIFEKAKPNNFTEKQKKTIEKCLGDDAGDGKEGQEDFTTIDAGDLESLFAEDAATDG